MDERLLPLPLSYHFLKLALRETIRIEEIQEIFMEPGRYG